MLIKLTIQLYIFLCHKHFVKVFVGDFAGVCTKICVRNILDG